MMGGMLQWGHAFVSVETKLVNEQRAVWYKLQWGHAFVSVETLIQPRLIS